VNEDVIESISERQFIYICFYELWQVSKIHWDYVWV